MHHHLHFLLLIALHFRRHRTSRYRFAFAFSSAASDRILVFTAFAFLETQHVAILFRFRICFFQRCFRPLCFYRIALHHSQRHSTPRYPFAFAITFVSALFSAAFSFFVALHFFGDSARSDTRSAFLFFSRTASCCIGFASLFGCALERGWLVRTYNQIDSIE